MEELRNLETEFSQIAQRLEALEFRPARFFAGGHAQTLLGYFYLRRFRLRSLARRDEARLFRVAPEVQMLARCRWQAGDRRKFPTLVLVHGLEGSSESVYMLGTAAKAFAAGYNVVRLNLRTCGGTENLTKTLYHSGMSEDLRHVLHELVEHDGLKQIFLAGFSLGGNMSLKLTGEYGEDAPAELRGVCAISPAIDLAVCAAAIAERRNALYNQRFVSSLKKKIRRIAKLYPDIYSAENISQVRTVYDFDTHFTAVHGGFRDVADYYARASSLLLIEKIRVPTLLIHAQDDPFVPFESFTNPTIAANPFVTLLAPKNGGHVGFIADSRQTDGDVFWAENRLIEFFQSIII